MSREIKFNVWNRKLKRFAPEHAAIVIGGDELQIYFDAFDGNFDVEVWYFDDCDLLQYTGLKDKSGTEIYEGDLIKLFDNGNGVAEVKFVNAYVGGWNLVNGQSSCSLAARRSEDVEVIGNIYQTPELLEESK